MAATDDHSLRTAVAALGGAGEAVVVADAERLHIVAANDTALALLGSDPLGHHIAWLLPDLVAEDLQHRITALLSIGERSIVFTARPRWEAEGGADVPVRVDVVERDGSPFVVAFIRDSPEDRASRPPREPASPLASASERQQTLDRLDAEVRRAFRHRRGLAVVHVRVDVRSGSPDESEQTLMTAARRLRDATRVDETFGRCDPDALLWILHETDLDGAVAAARRARRAIAGERGDVEVVDVGVASLRHGETAPILLRRAEQHRLADEPGGIVPVESGPSVEMGRLLRATSSGDIRAVQAVLADVVRIRGPLPAYDTVIFPTLRLLGEVLLASGGRRSADHRAIWLIDSAVARWPRTPAAKAAPVVAVMPFGLDARRITTQAVRDASASAGWSPLTLELAPGADAPATIGALGATAVIAVVGDDSDLLAVAHLVEDIREYGRGELVAVAAAPGSVLQRWSPPPPARSLESARAVAAALGGPVTRAPA
ncbi:MAG: PAS domain-containing protein [Actinobacteria bacterium]|nr:PAS domain-containing protein [Thermoleophilia bacterium]MCB9011266.1 PAS domain-containing protein [Actinomycetota bacterium]